MYATAQWKISKPRILTGSDITSLQRKKNGHTKPGQGHVSKPYLFSFHRWLFSRKHKACANTLSLSLTHTHTHTHTFISLSWLSHINKCPLTSFNPHSEWKMLLRNSEVGFFLPLIHLSWEKSCIVCKSRRCQLTYCTCGNGSYHKPLRKIQTSSKAPSNRGLSAHRYPVRSSLPWERKKVRNGTEGPPSEGTPSEDKHLAFVCMYRSKRAFVGVCICVFVMSECVHVYVCVLQDVEPPPLN